MKGDRIRGRLKALQVGVVFAVALGTPACNNDDEQIPGTYSVSVFEAEDTCDGEENQFTLVLDIRRQDDGFRVEINAAGQAGLLSGDIEPDGILVVTGTVTDTDGTRPRQVRLEMDIQRGRILEGRGLLTWNGTFPGVPGQCTQELNFTGFRENAVAPVVG
jgi:hypothetical protein